MKNYILWVLLAVALVIGFLCFSPATKDYFASVLVPAESIDIKDPSAQLDPISNNPETPQEAVLENDEDVDGQICTADAKMCADGSYVSRSEPGCAFAACPAPESEDTKTVICSKEMKNAEYCTMEYRPVCGLVEVQCIKAPCPPIPETFGNGCSACAQQNVISYTEGSCELEVR